MAVKKNSPETLCPIARAEDIVGDRWTVLVLRELFMRNHRYDEIQVQTGGTPQMVAARLKSLEADGMLERRAYSERPPRYEYVPTARGEDFRMVLMALVAWGNRHYAEEGISVKVVERETGRPVQPVMATPEGALVAMDQCEVQPGPAASAGMRQRLNRE